MILNNLFHSGLKAKSIKKKISFSTIFFASLIHRKLNYKLVSVQSLSTYNFTLLIFLSEHGRSDVSYGVLKYKVEYLFMEDYSENPIFQTFKRYLKGKIAK